MPGSARRSSGGSKAERAYAVLRQAIVTLGLEPGARIDKHEICRELGVSRHPISEALARLHRERLVEVEPQKGSYVARIRLPDVAESAFLRKAIEVATVRQLAASADAGLLDELARNLRYQQAAVDADDRDGFYELDLAFHRILSDHLGYPRAAAGVDTARGQLDRLRRLQLPQPGRIAATRQEHAAIHDALARHDGDAAAEAMRHHLEVSMAGVEALVESRPDLFEP